MHSELAFHTHALAHRHAGKPLHTQNVRTHVIVQFLWIFYFIFFFFKKRSIPKRQLLFTSQFESVTHLCLTSQAITGKSVKI